MQNNFIGVPARMKIKYGCMLSLRLKTNGLDMNVC